MAIDLEFSSTITERGQTTVPADIRRALGVGAGDRISFRLAQSGAVSVTRLEAESESAIDAFLAFLSNDIRENPAEVRPLDTTATRRAQTLTEGVEPLSLD